MREHQVAPGLEVAVLDSEQRYLAVLPYPALRDDADHRL